MPSALLLGRAAQPDVVTHSGYSLERKGKERKGKERKGKERKGKGKKRFCSCCSHSLGCLACPSVLTSFGAAFDVLMSLPHDKPALLPNLVTRRKKERKRKGSVAVALAIWGASHASICAHLFCCIQGPHETSS
eukprot:1144912-Pelagomonas_calceolata.AAC.11